MKGEILEDEVAIQRERYARIATRYESVHQDPEHAVAMAFLQGLLPFVGATSVLDVGAGTGRNLRLLRDARPDLRCVGVEPVAELRAVGHENGLPAEALVDGDGYQLPFADGEFDVVCEFAVLHHVREPNRVVAEMLRVAKRGVFMSDSNNFGGGSFAARLFKQSCHGLGLWPVVNYLKTGGRGYSISEGDGLFYSYSIFDSLPLLKKHCDIVHMMNTLPSSPNLYRTTPHVAVFGVKYDTP